MCTSLEDPKDIKTFRKLKDPIMVEEMLDKGKKKKYEKYERQEMWRSLGFLHILLK